MRVELIIYKDRIPFIIAELTKNNINTLICFFDNESDKIVFELESSSDVLQLFHAGIKSGRNQ
jgi:hypothetical protein